MNNDKELLELASKAAGVDGVYCNMNDWHNNRWDGIGYPNSHHLSWWNPLRSKSNCLQIEIDLKLDVEFDYVSSEWRIKGFMLDNYRLIAANQDRQRASTMAAAEIGRLI